MSQAGMMLPWVTIAQNAQDLGVHEMTISKWLRAADVEDGVKPGITADEAREIREPKLRNRLLEQENEVLRRAAAFLREKALPARERAGCGRCA